MKSIAFAGLACTYTRLEVARLPHSKELKYLVLESDPTPGYYSKGNFPVNKGHVADHHFYLLVKNSVNCFQDEVLRIASLIREETKLLLHVSPGQMTFNNQNYQGIRIKTDEVNHLHLVIDKLRSKGIKFIKDRKVEPYTSTIQFKRYIEFRQLEEGIYQDNHNDKRFFITLPKLVDFDQFLIITEHIKENCDFNLFDSFLTSLYQKDKMLDFAGIYSNHCDRSRLSEFRDNLTKELKTIDFKGG
jgi:hypothetical protein